MKDWIGKIADRPISAESHRELEITSKMEPLSDYNVEEALKVWREVNRYINDGLGRTDVEGEV